MVSRWKFISLPTRLHTDDLNRWHVFTALGGYIAVVVIDMLTAGKVHEDPTGQFAWPLPIVARALGSSVSKRED